MSEPEIPLNALSPHLANNRPFNALRRSKRYTSVQQVAEAPDSDLLSIEDFGEGCLREVRAAIRKLIPVAPTPEDLEALPDDMLLDLLDRARAVFEGRSALQLVAKVRQIVTSDPELEAARLRAGAGALVKVVFDSYDWDNGWFYHAGRALFTDANGVKVECNLSLPEVSEHDLGQQLTDLSLGGEHNSSCLLVLNIVTGDVTDEEADG
jgi:hypothetical protein